MSDISGFYDFLDFINEIGGYDNMSHFDVYEGDVFTGNKIEHSSAKDLADFLDRPVLAYITAGECAIVCVDSESWHKKMKRAIRDMDIGKDDMRKALYRIKKREKEAKEFISLAKDGIYL